MNDGLRRQRIHPLWWTAALVTVVIVLITLSLAQFNGLLRQSITVILASDRAGLVMNPGAKVKLRGVQVGTVGNIVGSRQAARLQLDIDPAQIRYIPANVQAEIKATTAFGTKYVDLIYPDKPTPARLKAGEVLYSRNITTEVNTVFQNLVDVLKSVDPAKVNAVISALAEGLRGRGQRMGEAITAANEVLTAYNARVDTVGRDWRSFNEFSKAYDVAANDILTTLDAASTTSTTLSAHAKELDSLLLNVIGFSRSGVALVGPNRDNLIDGINGLQPTTDLLRKYNPEYTCMLVGAKYYMDHGGLQTRGGNGYSLVIDSGLLFGKDPYIYPDNLPFVAAKGGPGGQPSCGSLPDVSKNFPVRQLITNTGWGTGLDIRTNPGIGHPCWADFLPVTRAVPEPPSIRQCIPGPAPGPAVPAGAPPYGAPQYAADGSPPGPAPQGAALQNSETAPPNPATVTSAPSAAGPN